MKKILFTFILCTVHLFSAEITTATKIMEKISSALIHKNKILVFSEDSKNTNIVKFSTKLQNSLFCEEADIVLTNVNMTSLCNEKVLLFTTNYLSFINSPDAIGAFFYQKGRPNIIFREENLKKHNITLPKEFDKYIE